VTESRLPTLSKSHRRDLSEDRRKNSS